MPDVLLFGATGHTGRLVAHALARRGAGFAVAGRDRSRLAALAREVGGPEIRVADASDPASVTRALSGCRVLISCVGPFTIHGDAAVRAALDAGVHYVDSCGEGAFIRRLAQEFAEPARQRGVALAPAMAFDEVPADLAATLSTEGMRRAELRLTYAIPSAASPGTVRSALRVLTAPGAFIANGSTVSVALGARRRWAPLPPPVGPRPTISAPLAELELAPLHLDLDALETYVAVGPLAELGARFGLAPVAPLLRRAPIGDAIGGVLARLLPAPPAGQQAGWWTLLAEARRGPRWRNVTLRGRDLYGLSAELLAAGAIALTADDFSISGVVSPVQALGAEFWHKELIERSVSIEAYEGRWSPDPVHTD